MDRGRPTESETLTRQACGRNPAHRRRARGPMAPGDDAGSENRPKGPRIQPATAGVRSARWALPSSSSEEGLGCTWDAICHECPVVAKQILGILLTVAPFAALVFPGRRDGPIEAIRGLTPPRNRV